MADLPADSTSADRARLPAAPITTACCLVAAAAYVGAVDPSGRTVLPPCPFRSVTGWWCPGCGLTRATHHLLHGDLVGALRYNMLLPVVLVLVAVLWLDWYARSIDRRPPLRRLPTWTSAVGIAVAVGFAVLRNLPGAGGLRG